MAVAKRQGREKPEKTEQRKVKGRPEDWSEDLRGTNSTPGQPNLQRAGPGRGGKNIQK